MKKLVLLFGILLISTLQSFGAARDLEDTQAPPSSRVSPRYDVETELHTPVKFSPSDRDYILTYLRGIPDEEDQRSIVTALNSLSSFTEKFHCDYMEIIAKKLMQMTGGPREREEFVPLVQSLLSRDWDNFGSTCKSIVIKLSKIAYNERAHLVQLNQQFRLIEDFPELDDGRIMKVLENADVAERASILRSSLLLLAKCTPPDQVEQITRMMKDIPTDEERQHCVGLVQDIVRAAQSLVTVTVYPDDRLEIINALNGISGAEAVRVVGLARTLFPALLEGCTHDGFRDDLKKVGFPCSVAIKAIKDAPDEEREIFLGLYQQLIVGANKTGRIWGTNTFIPDSRNRRLFLENVLRLFPAFQVEHHRDSIMYTLQQNVLPDELTNFVDQCLRLFRDQISSQQRKFLVDFLEKIPDRNRAARVDTVLQRFAEAEARGETQGAEDNVIEDIRRQVERENWVADGRPGHIPGHAEPLLAMVDHLPVMIDHRWEAPATYIHGYAQAMVASASGGSRIQLNDRIMEEVQRRLGATPLIEYDQVRRAVQERIRVLYAGEEYALATSAVDRGISHDEERQVLRAIYSFIEALHPDKIDLWISQFVGESITAYKSRTNPASCDKGITERAVTGLRRVDDELDIIFSEPESIGIMKGFSKNADPRNNPNGLARQLLELGVRKSTSPEEAGRLFAERFSSLLEHYHLQENPLFTGQPQLTGELIQAELENPESLLSKALKQESPRFLWRQAANKIKEQNRQEKEREERRQKLAAAAEARKKSDKDS